MKRPITLASIQPTNLDRADEPDAAVVLRFMLRNAENHDNATSLAEDAAHNALDADHDEWLDVETHWIWELAIAVIPSD
jgi:hypothetical protein